MKEPKFTDLTPETAKEYAEYLAAIFNTKIAGEYEVKDVDGMEMYSFPLADGSSADVWLECGKVYGEA